MLNLNQIIDAAGPLGLSPDSLMSALVPPVSRSTLNRQLSVLTATGAIKPVGAGRATRYVTTTPFTRADIDRYFSTPANSRPLAPFREELLAPFPNIDPERAARCAQIQALANPIDSKYLVTFLETFSWASGILEGSSYDELDTGALIAYGERNSKKPVEDAVLAMNHARAAKHLWNRRELTASNICAMQSLLTDNHGVVGEHESDHFLPPEKRGRVREYEEVTLQNSAYLPPFKPGTGHAARILDQIVMTAKGLPPVEASVYLLTRIPYAQSFSNGNKRTSRVAANLPLLAAGLVPFSFADVLKSDYIRGMAAFYELGSMHVIEQTFLEGYARSVVRSSRLPDSMRIGAAGANEVPEMLVEFLNTGRKPVDPRALAFVGSNGAAQAPSAMPGRRPLSRPSKA